MAEGSNKPAKTFYLIAGVALVWNLMGLGAYISQVTMTPEILNAMPDAERALYENFPIWATAAFAIAVNAGVLGCLLLLLKRSLALPVLILSLVAVVTQHFNTFVLMKATSVVGPVPAVFALAVIVIGAYLIWMANDAKGKGWLS